MVSRCSKTMSRYKNLSRCTPEHQGIEIEHQGVVKPCQDIKSYLGAQLNIKMLKFSIKVK